MVFLLNQHAFYLDAPRLPTPHRVEISGSVQDRVLCQAFLRVK